MKTLSILALAVVMSGCKTPKPNPAVAVPCVVNAESQQQSAAIESQIAAIVRDFELRNKVDKHNADIDTKHWANDRALAADLIALHDERITGILVEHTVKDIKLINETWVIKDGKIRTFASLKEH